MSEENKYGLEDLVTAAVMQQPVEFQNAFDDLVLGRIKSAVEDRKIEIAQTLYNRPPEDFETDVNDDEFGAGDIELDNSEEE